MSMHLATNTNLISFNADGSKMTLIDLLPFYARKGFRTLDVNLCEMLNPGSKLAGNAYREYGRQLLELKQAHELVFHQAHAPYAKDGHVLGDFLSRSMELCQMLDIAVLVVHPIKGTIEENIACFTPYVRQAEQQKLILAFENLTDRDELTTTNQLCELVDGFDAPSAGVCYDTGHAYMIGHDLVQDILCLGRRIKATHIADNHGKTDEHLLPFFGTIDWKAVVQAFATVNYAGYLTFECMFFNRHLPQELKSQALDLAQAVGKHLLSLVP